jgi:inorganic pyrophosphatase
MLLNKIKMNIKIQDVFILIILMFCFSGCEEAAADFKNLPAETSKGILAVIEIPSGTNRKIEYNYLTERFEIDIKDGKERVIDFLPYPGNYGFIPSTLMDKNRGGDGDALDILVIAESLKTGDTISVIPIGVLLLNDSGELDTKIIAVPADPAKQVIQATDYQTFTVKYNMAQKIIEHWFLNYKGLGVTKLIGWKNDNYAKREIEKWKNNE